MCCQRHTPALWGMRRNLPQAHQPQAHLPGPAASSPVTGSPTTGSPTTGSPATGLTTGDARICITELINRVHAHLPPLSQTFGCPKHDPETLHDICILLIYHPARDYLGSTPSIAEITVAAELWLPCKTYSFLSLGVGAPSATRCGTDTQVWALLQKMNSFIGTSDSEELEFFENAVLHVSFDFVATYFCGSRVKKQTCVTNSSAVTQHFIMWRSFEQAVCMTWLLAFMCFQSCGLLTRKWIMCFQCSRLRIPIVTIMPFHRHISANTIW